jgi:hypothetical protein
VRRVGVHGSPVLTSRADVPGDQDDRLQASLAARGPSFAFVRVSVLVAGVVDEPVRLYVASRVLEGGAAPSDIAGHPIAIHAASAGVIGNSGGSAMSLATIGLGPLHQLALLECVLRIGRGHSQH